jgi:hypothetical protein
MNDQRHDEGDVGPFARAALHYRRAGWLGTIPLPAGKKVPPPEGWTGWKAGERYPSAADVQTWLDEGAGAGNIGLRMPANVVGLDVDDYVKGEVTKTGLAAVAELEARWGQLPPTWRSTSRADGRSGIRLYRVPAGLRWPTQAAPSIEMIHSGHRYAVAAPSIHPDTRVAYTWIGPDGATGVDVPNVDDLPLLPTTWVDGLKKDGAAGAYESTGVELDGYIESLREGRGEPCRFVVEQLDGLREAVDGKSGEGRHDAVNERVMAIVRAGQMGHAGVERVLREGYRLWIEGMTPVRGAAGAQSEWDRSVDGAIDKVGPRPSSARCLCRTEAEQADQEAYFEGLAAKTTEAAIQTVQDALAAGEPVPTTGDYFLDEAIRRQRVQRTARRIVDAEEAEAELARADFGSEFLTRAQLASLPKPLPLIQGVLARTSTILLRGRDASFKSFVAIDWALCIATGTPWLHRDTEQGRVLYVMGEGAPGLNDRVSAWEEARGLQVPDDAFVVRASPVNLFKGGGAYLDLLRRVQDGGFSLIVLDTLRKVSGGADGNGSDMGVVVDRIEELRRATVDGGNGAILTIAHTAKDDVDTRGYSGIEDDQDIIWHCIRKEEGSPHFALRNSKQKNDRETDEMQLSTRAVGPSLVVESLAAGSRVVEDQGNAARRVWQVLVGCDQTGITQKAMTDDFKIPKTTAVRYLNRWVTEGRVRKSGSIYYADRTQTPEFDDALKASWGTAESAPEGWAS